MQQQDRAEQFAKLLQAETIASHVLKGACLHGIPENADLRAEAWRMLLGVVELTSGSSATSNDFNARNASKANKREQYYDLANELLKESPSSTTSSPKTPQDNWLDDIDKDVRRTQTSYAFFSQIASTNPKRKLSRSLFRRLDHIHPHRQREIEERYDLSPTRKGKERAPANGDIDDSQTQDRHFESLIRMLYIFALLNPVHYVQGMSELIAPLYYVFSQSSEKEDAEADCFWAFSNLMGEIGDFYVQDSDGSFGGEEHPADPMSLGVAGLGAAIRQFAKELHWIDAELAYNLHTQKEIQPTFYALRWITCLLAMDFRIPDLVRVWDSLLAMLADSTTQAPKSVSAPESEARAFLLDLCVAMVLVKRHELLSSSFSACLNILQNYVCEDVHTILTLAFSIRERRITSSLNGVDISAFEPVPSSPLPASDEFSSPSSNPNLQNARQALTAAASNISSTPTARALRQRLFKPKEGDFPDDMSDISTATAPAGYDNSWASPVKSADTSPATTTVSSSASSLLNKYAKSFASSDAAAQLNKMTTNSYITALSWKESAPSTFSKWKTDVSTKVSVAAGTAKTAVRPPSPHMDPPFTPPAAFTGRWLSPEAAGASPGSALGDRRGSGPKPLLLSSSARRASATLQQDSFPASPYSASNSRRTSYSGPSVGSGHSNLGLGLPRSLENSIHRSRTPSPTAPFRPDPHSRAASTSQLGSYRIANGRNGHAQSDHVRAGSLAVSNIRSPTSAKHDHTLADINEKPLPAVEEDVSFDKLSLAQSPPAQSAEQELVQPPQRPRRSIDRPNLSILRGKGASNDLEVLSDSFGLSSGLPEDIDKQSASSMSHFFQNTELSNTSAPLATPPQSPKMQQGKQRYPVSEVPVSPSRSNGSTLSRSVNRNPRTTSLAQIDTTSEAPLSPTRLSSAISPIEAGGDSATSQRPSRRRLASSRKLPRQDSIDSASVFSGDGES